MADINQQTEELARTFEQLTRELNSYNQLRKGTADQQRDAEIEAATGMKNFTKKAAASADVVGELAGAAMSAGKAMLEGKKGATAFNESLDGLSKAATAAGVALTLLVPGGAIIKGVVAGFTALTTATIGMVKASNEMAQKLYQGYSGLAKSGAAASDGMTGVFNDAKKLGLSMNQLDSFVGLVNENSKDLASFGKSVFEGRKQFADMGKAMEPFRVQLMAAGFTQEQINEGGMGYLALQTRLGRTQNNQVRTGEQLAQGAKKYIDELDSLTKLTGVSRKEIEDQRKAALNEEQFRAKLRQMELSGNKEGADRLRQYNDLMTAINPAMGAGIRALASGNLAAEEAQKLLLSSSGQAAVDLEKVMAGVLPLADAADSTAAAIGKFSDEVGVNLGLLKANDQTFLKLADQQDIRIAREKGFAEALKKIEEDRRKREQGAIDPITQKYAETEKKLQELNEKFEKTVFKGIDNALEVNVRLANATDVLATGFEKLGTVVNRLLNIVGLGVKEPVEPPKPKTAKEAEAVAAVAKERSLAQPLEQLTATKRKQLEADEKALLDAKRSGKFGDDLKPLEEKIVKSKEEYAAASKDLANQQKKVVDATREERKVQMQQKQDQNRLMLLEGINIRETESIARLNVEKADLVKKGIDTAKQDLKIAEFKTSIEERNKQIATIKSRLAPVAPKVQTDASGRATATSDSRTAAAGTTPAAPTAPTVPTTAPAAPATQAPPGAAAPAAGGVNEAEQQIKAQNLFNFLGGVSGRETNYNRLDSQFRERLTAMASEYQGLTNKKLDFSSGARSDEENKKVGGVGTSNHLKGQAVDLSTQSVNELINLGLLGKYGFTQNPKSGWHISDNGYADGGIASGPDSGYNALLHGTEAIIPLKNGAVPVRLFGESPDDDTELRMPDMGPLLSTVSTTMFAAIESLKDNTIDSGFDREMRQEVVEPVAAAVSEAPGTMPVAPVARESSVMMDLLREAKQQNTALLDMLSELVREQRNANNISARILQVAGS